MASLISLATVSPLHLKFSNRGAAKKPPNNILGFNLIPSHKRHAGAIWTMICEDSSPLLNKKSRGYSIYKTEDQ